MYYETKKKLLMSSGGYAAQYFTIVIESDGEDQMLCFGVKGHQHYGTPITLTLTNNKDDTTSLYYLYKGTNINDDPETELTDLNISKEDTISFEYSINGAPWKVVNHYKPHVITGLKKRDKIRIKSYGQMNHFIGGVGKNQNYLVGAKFNDKNIIDNHVTSYSVLGNIMSLYWGSKFRGKTIFRPKNAENNKNKLIPYKYSDEYKVIKIHNGINVESNEVIPNNIPEAIEENINPCYCLFKSGTTYIGGDYNEALISAENLCLPAKIVGDYEYFEMFRDCESLEYAPKKIDATTLGESSCEGMFAGCKSLLKTPKIIANTVGKKSCLAMFIACYKLQNCPDLKPTVLAESCYEHMFAYCPVISLPDKFSGEQMGADCYYGMFSMLGETTNKNEYINDTTYKYTGNSQSIIKLPEIIIKDWKGNESGCKYMFAGRVVYISSTSGITIPKDKDIPANSFSNMFNNCMLYYNEADIPSEPNNKLGIHIDTNRCTLGDFKNRKGYLNVLTNNTIGEFACDRMFYNVNGSNKNIEEIKTDEFGDLKPLYNFHIEAQKINKKACNEMFSRSGIQTISIVCNDKIAQEDLTGPNNKYKYTPYKLFIDELGCNKMCYEAEQLNLINLDFFPSQVYGYYYLPVPNHPNKNAIYDIKDPAKKIGELHHVAHAYYADKDYNYSACILPSYGLFDFTYGVNVDTNHKIFIRKANNFAKI